MYLGKTLQNLMDVIKTLNTFVILEHINTCAMHIIT